jgi:transcription antitermination factor NusG
MKYQIGRNRLSLTSNSRAGEKRWYIFYLRPHTENRVYRLLTNLNYEVFWPVIQSIRIWKNRQKKKIKLPLFPNYLFVYTYAHELFTIKCLPQVVSYVTCGGKPSTIPDKEIVGIRQMLGLDRAITVETKFSKGEGVRIVSGPLKGYEGVLVKQHSKTRFGILLKAINFTVLIDIDIDRSELEKL